MGATSAGQIGLDLVINRNNFDSQLKGITRIAKRAGAAITAAFGSKLFVDFGKQCIELGSDLAEVQNVVDVTFTSMSAKVDKFTQNAAKQFGLSETMAKRYTGTFGAMAKAFGLSEKQAYDMSTALTGLAGDVASFYNIGQDEAYTKLKSVFTGETESLKDLGVVMTQTALDQYAMQNGFGKTTKAMSEQEKVALRYAFVQSQLNTAAGDFSRTSGSWANQVRLLTLQFESLKASIGQGLIAAFTPAIRAVNAFIGRILTAINTVKALFASLGKAGQVVGGVADKFKKFTGNTNKASARTKGLSGAGGDAAASMQSLGSGSDSAGKKASKAAKKAGDAAKKAAKKMRSLMGFDQINKVDKKENTGSSGSGGTGGGSAGSGGVGGGAIDAGLSDMDTGMEKTSKKSLKLGKIWKNLVGPVTRLKKAFGEFWGIMKSAGGWVWNNILVPLGKWTISKLAPKLIDVLAGAFRVLSKILKALAPIWQKLWDVFFKPIAKFTGKVIILALDLLAKGLNKIADFAEKHPKAFQVIATGLTGLFAGSLIFKKLGGTLGIAMKFIKVFTLFDSFKFKVLRKFEMLKKVFMGVGKAFKTLGTLIAAHPIAALLIAIAAAAFLIYKNWDKIKKTKFGKALTKAGQTLKKFGSYLAGAFKKTIEKVKGIVEGLKKAWEGIKDRKAELQAEAKEKVEGALAAISGAWENIKDKSAQLLGEAKEKVSGAIKALKDGWESVKDKTAELKAQVASKWADLKSKWNSLLGNFKDKTVKIGLDIAAKVSNIKKAFNNHVISPLNSKIHKIPLLKKVSIPYLAQGGFVQKNTPQLAMIGDNRHQGEIVAPEDKLEAMAINAAKLASGGGNQEMITLLRQMMSLMIQISNRPIYLDGKDVTDKVVKRINDVTKSTGNSPILI